MIPKLQRQGKRTVLVVDSKPFVALAGEVHNSDASSPEYMEKIWETADRLGMNTLILPVTWEMTEPEEGYFDFSIPQKLIDQGRKWNKHIIFLWFGSWKNAECMYAPEWVKRDMVRFPRGQVRKGENKTMRRVSEDSPDTVPYTTISYFSENAMWADAGAFARLMRFLKEYDENKTTVIAVQVENETGLLGAAREHSEEADQAFSEDVPDEFVAKMRLSTEEMVEDVRRAVESGAVSGSWTRVFGNVAEEIFSAYYISRFVGFVAEAGKAEYPLPMTVNCWIDTKGAKPGSYPSGGPVSRMQEVWKINAPAIDIYSPDIYLPQFYEICDEYTRRGNSSTPLFIAETAVHSYCASRLVNTVGQYHAICYSPFGFDDIGKPFTLAQGVLFGMDVSDPALKTPQNFEEYAATQKLLSALLPVFGPKLGTDDLQATSGEKGAKSCLHTKDVNIVSYFQSAEQPRSDGYLLVVRSGLSELYLLGNACRIQLMSCDGIKKNLDYLIIEEEIPDDAGLLRKGRRLNGDEMAMLEFTKPAVLKIRYLIYT